MASISEEKRTVYFLNKAQVSKNRKRLCEQCTVKSLGGRVNLINCGKYVFYSSQ